MTLKTLNDIKPPYTLDESYKCGFERCKELLKREGIKWIKEFRRIKEECEHDMFYRNKDGLPFFFRLENEHWIKHFFNITEEDLK